MTKKQRSVLEAYVGGLVQKAPTKLLVDAVKAVLAENDQLRKDLAAVYASLNGG